MNQATYDFIIYLAEPWGTFFRRHLIMALARGAPKSKILCVERPAALTSDPVMKRKEFKKWSDAKRAVKEVNPNLFLWKPYLWVHDHLAPRLPLARMVNRRALKGQLKKVMGELGFRTDRTVAWIYDPFQVDYLGLADEALSVYECYDDYLAQPPIPGIKTPAIMAAKEKRIFQKVDLVFVVSERLAQKKKGCHPNLHVLTNATDAGLWKGGGVPILPEIERLPKPRIGYWGNLTPRMDFALLFDVASRMPKLSFVFVGGEGRSRKELGRTPGYLKLRNLHNVYFLGPKPYEEFRGFIEGIDVGLIPYRTDEFNLSCSPLKLYDYLASGKAVVSTPIADVLRFKDLAYTAEDSAGFCRSIELALREDSEVKRSERRVAGLTNSWEQRARSIVSSLSGLAKL